MNKIKLDLGETYEAPIYTINDKLTIIEDESIYSIISEREIEFLKIQDQYYHYVLKKS